MELLIYILIVTISYVLGSATMFNTWANAAANKQLIAVPRTNKKLYYLIKIVEVE